MKINKTLLFFASLYLPMNYTSDLFRKDFELSKKDKEWLLYYLKTIDCSIEEWEDFSGPVEQMLGDEEIVFNILEKRFIDKPNNKMNHLMHALRWCDFLKQKNKFKSNDYWNISQLITNEKIYFKNGHERDTIFFKLMRYSTSKSEKIDPIRTIHFFTTSSDVNKVLYFTQPKFTDQHSLALMNCNLKNLRDANSSAVRSVFKPIMYSCSHDNLICYTYKEVTGLDNIPLYLKCLKWFEKKYTIKIPRVLSKFIIEGYILKNPYASFANIKKEAESFKEYCNHIETSIPSLIESEKYYIYDCFPNAQEFKNMYNALKK